MNTPDIFSPSAISLGKQIEKYQRLEYELIVLSGYSLETLRDLFARGYTITPPKPLDTSYLARLALEV